jgi:hypothetical protein
MTEQRKMLVNVYWFEDGQPVLRRTGVRLREVIKDSDTYTLAYRALSDTDVYLGRTERMYLVTLLCYE